MSPSDLHSLLCTDMDLGVPFTDFLHHVSCVSLVSLTPGLVVPKRDTFSVQGAALLRSKSLLSQLLW